MTDKSTMTFEEALIALREKGYSDNEIIKIVLSILTKEGAA